MKKMLIAFLFMLTSPAFAVAQASDDPHLHEIFADEDAAFSKSLDSEIAAQSRSGAHPSDTKPYVVIDTDKAVSDSQKKEALRLMKSKKYAIMISVDDFDERRFISTRIPTAAYPSYELDFPYAGVRAYLHYGCLDTRFESLGLHFNKSNLAAGNREYGREIHSYKVKWDKEIRTHKFSEGDDVIFFQDDMKSLVGRLLKTSELTIEVKWFRQGSVRFKMDVAGFGETVAAAREICKSGDKGAKAGADAASAILSSLEED